MKKGKTLSIVILCMMAILFTGASVNYKEPEAQEEKSTTTVYNKYENAGVTRTVSKLLSNANVSTTIAIESNEIPSARDSFYDETGDTEESEPEIVYEEIPMDSVKYVYTDYLNLRTGASTDSDVLDVLTYGDELHVIGEMHTYVDNELIDVWVHVTSGEYTGYVYSDYIIDTPPYINLGVYDITYYCPCEICCGWNTGITASGAIATAGTTIAADSSIPFGTEIIIDGHVYTVQDRGSAIIGNHIDIFCNTHEEALSHTRHNTEVYMKTEVN